MTGCTLSVIAGVGKRQIVLRGGQAMAFRPSDER
jgi:hypothetical protein